jgi:hypothetical protein
MQVYSSCSPIVNGCFLYSDPGLTTPVSSGKYSDGINCYTITNGIGQIEVVSSCTTTTTTTSTSTSTTTTTTSSSTTTTTTTEPYVAYYADKFECSGCTVDSNVQIAFPTSFTPNPAKWYIPATPDGFSYQLNGGAAPGPGLIMAIFDYNTCAAACLG